MLPVDAVVAAEFKRRRGDARRCAIDAVPADAMILDVGPATVAALDGSGSPTLQTLVWNGPLGAFETPPFDAGDDGVWRRRWRAATAAGALRSVAGGGDTVSALRHAGRGGQDELRLRRRRRVPGVAGRQDLAGGGRARPVTEDCRREELTRLIHRRV